MYYGERLNSISHLVGAVLALIALGSLLTIAVQSGDPWIITSFALYGFTLVLLYTISTLYHSFHPPHLKRLFKVLDHVSIYLLIAGTYTPFTLVLMRDGSGWWLLSLVWSLAAVGIVSELTLSGKAAKAGQLLIYLAMGWACALDLGALRAALGELGYTWLVAGGIAYTVGVVFYLLDKANALKHAHGIWHVFVLTGSACHAISVLGYVR